jgi:hypothetical protein
MSEVNNYPSSLDQQQIIQQAYDESLQRLRVDAEVTATIGEVTMDAATSSVSIGDGTTGNIMKVNADGSIDVNTVITSTADSIAIGNQAGTNFLAVNTDGSIKSVQLFTLPFDTITALYPTSTQEQYQSRVGGISGTVQQTLTVNYTDITKAFILNVVRT